jgi:hypothetical protein
MFMKITSLKKVLITVSLLVSVMYTVIASAHDQPGDLGTAAEATDMYRVTCTPDVDPSDHLFVPIVISDASGPKVSVQVFKDGMALNTTTGVNIGTKALKGGDGEYSLIVNKSAAGAASYIISFHCESSSGDHTSTDIDQLQDQ